MELKLLFTQCGISMTLFSFQTDNRDVMSNFLEKCLWEIFEASNPRMDDQNKVGINQKQINV